MCGFDRIFDGFYKFFGRLNSYIEFFNCGKIDIKWFIIFVVWIKYEGFVGFIFNYVLNGRGVNFWVILWIMLFVCFMYCINCCFMKVIKSYGVVLR